MQVTVCPVSMARVSWCAVRQYYEWMVEKFYFSSCSAMGRRHLLRRLFVGCGDQCQFGCSGECFDCGFPSQCGAFRVQRLGIAKDQRPAMFGVLGAFAGLVSSHSLLQIVGDAGVETAVGALDNIHKPHCCRFPVLCEGRRLGGAMHIAYGRRQME